MVDGYYGKALDCRWDSDRGVAVFYIPGDYYLIVLYFVEEISCWFPFNEWDFEGYPAVPTCCAGCVINCDIVGSAKYVLSP